MSYSQQPREIHRDFYLLQVIMFPFPDAIEDYSRFCHLHTVLYLVGQKKAIYIVVKGWARWACCRVQSPLSSPCCPKITAYT